MTAASLVPLAGSQRAELPQARSGRARRPGRAHRADHRHPAAAALPRDGERRAGPAHPRRAAAQLRRRPADHELVADMLTGLDPAIQVTGQDPGSRRVTVAGPVWALANRSARS